MNIKPLEVDELKEKNWSLLTLRRKSPRSREVESESLILEIQTVAALRELDRQLLNEIYEKSGR